MIVEDLERPVLPWTVRAANAALAPVAARIRLDEVSLRAAARSRAGLEDFGDPAHEQGLRVLLGSLEHEAGLSPLGRVLTRQGLVQLLVARLRVVDLVRHHPEILDEPVEAPLFVVGQPRTGTTHLHELLSQDERLRSLPYWESLEPVPRPGERRRPGRSDPRIIRCEASLRIVDHAMPRFRAMHEMTAEGPHEEIQLLAVAFESMYFEAGWDVPGYVAWYQDHDQTSAYEWLKVMLQVLQWLRGGRRWVLKSPQHLEQLATLFRVFPDALVVQTHRDPVAVTASLVTMIAYTRRMQHEAPFDLRRIGATWSARLEGMLRASIDDRADVPAGRILDVRFHEFMADEPGTLEAIGEFAGLPVDRVARRSFERFLATHRRGRHGRLQYRLGPFGIDAGERRAALRFYSERFDLPDEEVR